ncbi:hypothetical protein RJT34_11721 [Clitoria ternatea]|uniref:Exocyst subunit Exo70 family protein n=1 Tax=Clitoria ternatea TaxID=43366 RepID=A0AAN9JKG3_CLITE
MQPRVWRFLCFKSSIVGLFSYALSSSFNHLFGKWNLWKMLIYSAFSFIICLTILFAKAWQHSPSRRVKAQLAFLVLIITSVYSFFLDKVLNGKPDAYSIISCAAFAVMSLGLSRQTHCGFEVDLLYFFSGCLIIQLMKINLLLILVGAGFSYSLIVIRSYLDDQVESGHLRIQVQDQVVIVINSDSQETNSGSATQMNSPQSNSGTTSTSTNCLMPLKANNNGPSDAAAEIQGLEFQDHIVRKVDSPLQQGNSDSFMPQLMRCIEGLKKENQNLIRTVSKHVEEYLKTKSDSEEDRISGVQLHPDDNLVIDSLPSEVITNLHETVKLLVAAGLEKKCCHLYSRCRRKFLKEWLSRFKLHELNKDDDDKMEKIESWIKAFNIVVRILFRNERKLCNRIFLGFSSSADNSFTKVCKKLTIHLLSLVDIFATRSHLPNLLSAIIPKVFKALCDLIPEFESLFSDPYSASLTQVHMAWGIIPLKMEFNKLISRDMAQATVSDGRIQRITIEVMDRLYKLSKELTSEREMKSPLLFLHMASLIDILESNLEAKSKNYIDTAMAHVYMMNNLRCIEQMAKQHELKNILGDDWLTKNAAKIQKKFELYQRCSWNKVLGVLKLEKNEPVARSSVAESMKVKLNLFNLQFEETCNIQSMWSVFDEQLREQMITSLERTLLPAYGNFIERFCDVLGKHADPCIKYGIFHIQDQLNHLFLVSEPVNPVHEIWKEDIDLALQATSKSFHFKKPSKNGIHKVSLL